MGFLFPLSPASVLQSCGLSHSSIPAASALAKQESLSLSSLELLTEPEIQNWQAETSILAFPSIWRA